MCQPISPAEGYVDMYQLAQASACIALKKAWELLYLVSATMLQVPFAWEFGHQFPLKLIQQNPSKTHDFSQL